MAIGLIRQLQGQMGSLTTSNRKNPAFPGHREHQKQAQCVNRCKTKMPGQWPPAKQRQHCQVRSKTSGLPFKNSMRFCTT